MCELRKVARKEVTRWAAKLIEDRGSDAITSPTVIEMLCGTRNKHELNLTRAYLSKFRVIDEGKITEQDVFHAQRLVAILQHRGQTSPPRDLGDCLIQAIALRLKCDIDSNDRGFLGMR